MSTIFKLENVELMWPFLYERNKLSGKYQVDVINLEPEQVEAIEKTGTTVRQKEGKGFYITCKSSQYEIRPYDKDGNELTGVTIGNGTKATIMAKPYSWKSPTGQSGVSIGIAKLIITDLKEYVREPVEAEETL
jgi:hypothetical protein